jgi:hypothetical protein
MVTIKSSDAVAIAIHPARLVRRGIGLLQETGARSVPRTRGWRITVVIESPAAGGDAWRSRHCWNTADTPTLQGSTRNGVAAATAVRGRW